MPVRAASAGLKDELHQVASSASQGDSIPGAYGEKSSEISLSSDSPIKKNPKGTPEASSHGTPAAGSVHLDIPSSDAETVQYDDQQEAEGSIPHGDAVKNFIKKSMDKVIKEKATDRLCTRWHEKPHAGRTERTRGHERLHGQGEHARKQAETPRPER